MINECKSFRFFAPAPFAAANKKREPKKAFEIMHIFSLMLLILAEGMCSLRFRSVVTVNFHLNLIVRGFDFHHFSFIIPFSPSACAVSVLFTLQKSINANKKIMKITQRANIFGASP